MKRYSTVLGQNIETTELGIVCDDKTEYTKKELDDIRGLDKREKQTIHNLKKIFCGEII